MSEPSIIFIDSPHLRGIWIGRRNLTPFDFIEVYNVFLYPCLKRIRRQPIQISMNEEKANLTRSV